MNAVGQLAPVYWDAQETDVVDSAVAEVTSKKLIL